MFFKYFLSTNCNVKIHDGTPSMRLRYFQNFGKYLTFYFVILVLKRFIMNSFQLKYSPDREYPAIELDMTNFMEHLSNENTYGKTEAAENDGVRTSPKVIDCKTEDCTDLTEISSIPEIKLEQEEKVSKFGRISYFIM